MKYTVNKISAHLIYLSFFVLALFSCTKKKVQSFDQNGNLKQSYEVDENGLPNGQLEEYDQMVNVILRGNYVNGKRHGEFTHYTKNGNVLKSKIYSHDSLKKISTYYPNGEVESISYWEGGQKQSLRVEKYTLAGKKIDLNPDFEVIMPDTIYQGERVLIKIVFNENHEPFKLLYGTLTDKGFLREGYKEIWKSTSGIFELEFVPSKIGQSNINLVAVYKYKDGILEGKEIKINYHSYPQSGHKI